MADLELLSVVALMRDLPEAGLARGQVGTVVEVLGPEVFEVEFSDDTGRTYAALALKAHDLLRLHHEPLHEAA
ncbi:MAG TPA: DUF4926 domain-containing protein [Bryobacteraceae bacterium]|nr:DUF4926 domain-containing protein [Bryobacteraceae bacterium]